MAFMRYCSMQTYHHSTPPCAKGFDLAQLPLCVGLLWEEENCSAACMSPSPYVRAELEMVCEVLCMQVAGLA